MEDVRWKKEEGRGKMALTVKGSMTTELSAANSSDTFASGSGVFRKASCTVPKTRPCACADVAATRARMRVMMFLFITFLFFSRVYPFRTAKVA